LTILISSRKKGKEDRRKRKITKKISDIFGEKMKRDETEAQHPTAGTCPT
jgi:hypothetical protein